MTEADLLLEATVNSLYGDFRTKDSPSAVLEIQFVLIDDTGTAPVVLFHKGYLKEVPIDRCDPEALAEGWTAALGQVLSTLENDLAGRVASP